MRQFSPQEQFAAGELARSGLYFFSRWMFHERRKYKWLRSPHHKIICDALMRVYSGECKRLIINIPPRYSKTELAVVNFIAWALGQAPDAEFIHASYSSTLAVNNSAAVRGLLQHEAYQAIFPGCKLASEAKAHWTTTAGGVMYSAGAGGTITGFGAGKHRPGFGGCFPVGTRVWTEFGLVPIDRIVKDRLQVNVWSFDYAGQMVLRPVIGWHQNPPNEIVRVTFDDGATVECTPDHRFWTDNRGWVRADSLCVEDHLPAVNGSVKSLDGVRINAERRGGRLNPEAVLSACPVGATVEGDIRLLLGKDRAPVCLDSALSDDAGPTSDGLPRVAAPNLIDDRKAHAIGCGKFNGGCSDSVIDCERLHVGQDGYRMDFSLTERPVALAVDDVRGSAVISQVAEIVVSWVAVRVANIEAGRAGSDESRHYKGVNGRISDDGALGEADPQVAARFYGRLEHLPRLDVGVTAAVVCDASVLAFDASVVTDRVKPFISGSRKPVLVERIRHDDSTFCLTVKEHHNFTVESGLVVKNCIIIDDPHKPDEARSDVMRQGVIDWFQNTLESRKNSPETPIIVIMQRLHEEDLAGWLAAGGNGEQWEHVCLPAIQADGSALWPEKHDLPTLRRMEQAAPYVFAGQYQQRPAPAEGGIFKPDQLQVIDALPAMPIQWVRGWDLASTTDGDWTAGGKLGKLPDGRLVIADMVRLRAGPDERDAAIVNTAAADGRPVKVSIPQDPGQAGKTQVLYLTRSLVGHRVISSPESGDKITRAEPFAAQVNIGNVLMLRGEWNHHLREELRMFPNGTNDDQVDALSRAFSDLIGRSAMKINPDLLNRA